MFICMCESFKVCGIILTINLGANTLRTFSLSVAVIAALLSGGCATTSAEHSAVTVNQAVSGKTLLTARLQPVAGVVTSDLTDNSIKISFVATEAFSHAGAGISDELQQQLTLIAQILKDIQFQRATVLGHTDNSGKLAFNNALSQQRAEQVRGFLQQQGMDPAHLAAQGRGPAEPIADNSTKQGKAANRRVEIVIDF
jgi:outer membrane protein OmpA-like peptidoglycan-associated protein